MKASIMQLIIHRLTSILCQISSLVAICLLGEEPCHPVSVLGPCTHFIESLRGEAICAL